MSVWEQVKKEAEQYTEEKDQSGGGFDGLQLVTMFDDATSTFRLYADRDLGTWSRSIFRHTIGNKKPQCTGVGCKMCAAAEKANQMGYGSAWKFNRKEICIAYGSFFSHSLAVKNEIPLEEPLLLMFPMKVRREISRKISELPIEKIDDLFTHDKEMPVLSLAYKGGKGGNVSLGFDGFATGVLKDLPDDAKPIAEAFIAPDKLPTEQEIANFVSTIIDTARQAVGSNVVNPTNDSTQEWPDNGDQAAPAQAPADTEAPSPVEPVSTETPANIPGDCPSAYGKYTDPNPVCIMCDHEAACKQVTAGASA